MLKTTAAIVNDIICDRYGQENCRIALAAYQNNMPKSSLNTEQLKVYKLLNFFSRFGLTNKLLAKRKLANITDRSINTPMKKAATTFKSIFTQALKEKGVDIQNLPQDLSLDELNRLNPSEHFEDIPQALSLLIQQQPICKLRIHDDDLINADFYVSLAQKHEESGRNEDAFESYGLSLLFSQTPTAHEHLGNIAKNKNQITKAIFHYEQAIELQCKSEWVYLNLGLCYGLNNQKQQAINCLTQGLINYPLSEILASNFDNFINDYWIDEEQHLNALAVSQKRQALIDSYNATGSFITKAYSAFFSKNNAGHLRAPLNKNRVLIVGISASVLPQCYRYRIEQKIEQLKFSNYEAEYVLWSDTNKALSLINFYDLVIFYRVPALPGVLKQVAYAKSLGKITFFEIDDLLFDISSVPPLESYGGQISIPTYANLTKDIGGYNAIATQCDYAIASTKPLLEKLTPLVGQKKGFLHRNGLDKYSQPLLKQFTSDKEINLFYGSGTLAHNSDFILEALPAITKILSAYPHVRLIIMGYLTLPEQFTKSFQKQLIQIPFTKDISTYYSYISNAHINIAVLHEDKVTACKSELKWFEAGAFSIPSVVSRTENYTDVVKNNIDGFIVKGETEWFNALDKLISDKEFRLTMGQKAYHRVTSEYTTTILSKNISTLLNEAIEHKESLILQREVTPKKKIALVNVFFPPNARGGATRVLVDQVSVLQAKYGNDFDLVVFTADSNSPNHYSLNSYMYCGIRVYKVALPYTESTNRREKDVKVAALFEQFIDFEKPDIIHFHCIQVLTASLLEVAQDKKIPNYVTIHDAWWISDHQFLFDAQGKVYPEGHPNMFDTFVLPDGVSLEQSIKRRSYLKQLLNNSNGVFSVSETFKRIYEKNGVNNVITNKNGISNEVLWGNKITSFTNKVVCAHIGGVSAHKGFYVFKKAVLALKAKNIEVLIVDHSKAENYKSKAQWGTVDVITIGHVGQDKISDLYQKIDVLFAPSTCPESFGLVTREATACGCWVVASDLGGIGEDVTKENGFCVEPTVENILHIFGEIEAQPEKYKTLSKSGAIRRSSEQVDELVNIFKQLT